MSQPATPTCLSIAGSDPSAGAGIQLDIRVFESLRCYPSTVTTAITAQNSSTVTRVELLSPELVRNQLITLLSEVTPHAAKSGMLGSVEIAEACLPLLLERNIPLVLDPIMKSSSCSTLGEITAAQLRRIATEFASLITPNIGEATALLGTPIDSESTMKEAASQLAAELNCSVLLKGGHLNSGEEVVSYLVTSHHIRRYSTPRIDGATEVHGTGCALSAAITANLALGASMEDAVTAAQTWLAAALLRTVRFGSGKKVFSFAETLGAA